MPKSQWKKESKYKIRPQIFYNIKNIISKSDNIKKFFVFFRDFFVPKMGNSNAVESSNKEIVKLLIEKGANVNAETNLGLTALTIAKEFGNAEIIKFLRTVSK